MLTLTCSRGYKSFSSSTAEHEILNAQKYEYIKKFSGPDRPRNAIFLLINVKMPTIVGILTFMNRKKSCSAELSMKKFYNIRACCMSDDFGLGQLNDYLLRKELII